jgi:glycosyltransferase involved in cell wall biosynthesis
VPQEADHALKLGVKRENLRLIPNGVDIGAMSFEQLYERRKTLDYRPTLGFIGRLVHQKNPLLFIEVLREVIQRGCNVSAIVLGDGPLRPAMVHLATSLGINDRIDWRGEFPARSLYPEIDILVHTSLYEALPYSLIEANAALLPIVAVRNSGSEAVLGRRLSQNLSDQSNSKGLASIVTRILDDNQLRLDQLKICREIALDYSTDRMINSYEILYNELWP